MYCMQNLLASVLASAINVLPGSVAEGFVWGILTIGVFISFKVLNVADMSVEGTLALGGTVTAAMTVAGVPIWLTMLVAVLCGAASGAITAIMHTKLKIPAILAGILTMFALYSVNIHVLGNRASLALLNKPTLKYLFMRSFGATSIIADIVISGLFVACSLGIIYLFFKTRAGYSVRATGCNPAMARAQGINTDRDIIVALAISNGLAALSGSLLAQINTGATANMGTGAIVIGLAGVVLGEAVTRESFPFGAKLAAVILGSVIYRVVLSLAIQLVTFLTMDDLKLISAVIILAVLAAKRFAPKHKKGKKKQSEVSGGGAEGV